MMMRLLRCEVREERYTGNSVARVRGVFVDLDVVLAAGDPQLRETRWGPRLMVEVQDLFPDLAVVRLPVVSSCGLCYLLIHLCDSLPLSLLGPVAKS